MPFLRDKKKEEIKDDLVDSAGRPVNEYIPKFIAEAPWYLKSGNEKSGYLDHQTKRDRDDTFDKMDTWYEKGKFTTRAKKYRKGACENCGAMTHTAKDCVERPRKLGAKFTNKDIAPDEIVNNDLNLSWDGKRDRWNGFHPDEYKRTMSLYDQAEAERRKYKVKELSEKFMTEPDADHVRFANSTVNRMVEKKDSLVEEKKDSDSDDELNDILSDDDDNGKDDNDYTDILQKEDAAEVFKDFSTERMKQSVRNLRIREDTAAYLKDFKSDKSYYDPKSRSIRSLDNSKENDKFCPSDFVKASPDVKKFTEAQMFAWEAHSSGGNVNIFANPTAVELMQREYKVKKEKLQEEQKKQLLEKYGQQPDVTLPKDILYGSSETYTKYKPDGTLAEDNEKSKISMYPEDIFPGNHSSVWGSWYDRDNMKWGYACCHQLFYNAYCTAEKK